MCQADDGALRAVLLAVGSRSLVKPLSTIHIIVSVCDEFFERFVPSSSFNRPRFVFTSNQTSVEQVKIIPEAGDAALE